MNCNVLFPWFPIKSKMKHLVRKNRMQFYWLFYWEDHFWHHHLAFPTNPKRKAALCLYFGRRQANSTLRCSPQACPRHVQTRGAPRQPRVSHAGRGPADVTSSTSAQFSGSPLTEKVSVRGRGREGKQFTNAWLWHVCCNSLEFGGYFIAQRMSSSWPLLSLFLFFNFLNLWQHRTDCDPLMYLWHVTLPFSFFITSPSPPRNMSGVN